MALPATDITVTLVKTILSESTNNVTELCDSPNINQWSLYKPANYGIGYDTMSGVKPIGLASTGNGRRLGDFRGYNHTAQPPIRLHTAYNTSHIYTDIDGWLGATILTTDSEMRPTANNNGFAPDYVTDIYGDHTGEAIRMRAEMWLSGSMVGSGDWLTSYDEESISDSYQLPVVYTSGLSAATYSIRVRQQVLYETVWSDRGYIDGGYDDHVMTSSIKYTITGSIPTNDLTQITLNWGVAYTTTGDSEYIDLDLTLEFWEHNGSAYEMTGSSLLTSVTVGSGKVNYFAVQYINLVNKPYVKIINTNTSYLYNTINTP